LLLKRHTHTNTNTVCTGGWVSTLVRDGERKKECWREVRKAMSQSGLRTRSKHGFVRDREGVQEGQRKLIQE
jgi:hypothetical protein